MAQHTPLKKLSTFSAWFYNDLKRLVYNKKAAHRLLKMTGKLQHRETFISLRRQCKALAERCLQDCNRKVEDRIPHNIKCFWSHINTLKNSQSPHTRLLLDGQEADGAEGQCELFSKFFSSVFNNAAVPSPTFDFGLNFSISHCTITALDVLRKLESLDPNKGAGPDAIPPSVLKHCAPILVLHLSVWFSSLLNLGIFPSVLKRGYVVPIF